MKKCVNKGTLLLMTPIQASNIPESVFLSLPQHKARKSDIESKTEMGGTSQNEVMKRNGNENEIYLECSGNPSC